MARSGRSPHSRATSLQPTSGRSYSHAMRAVQSTAFCWTRAGCGTYVLTSVYGRRKLQRPGVARVKFGGPDFHPCRMAVLDIAEISRCRRFALEEGSPGQLRHVPTVATCLMRP